MAQDNPPLAPKESIFKRARYGFISLAFILASIIILVIKISYYSSPYRPVALLTIGSRLQWLWLLLTVLGAIFTGISLKADKAKAFSKVLLFAWSPYLCILCWLIFIFILTQGGRSVM